MDTEDRLLRSVTNTASLKRLIYEVRDSRTVTATARLMKTYTMRAVALMITVILVWLEDAARRRLTCSFK